MSFRALFDFEAALADYTGAPYVVETDGCTHALELCFRYDAIQQTSFTAYTYLSVPMMLTHLGVAHTFTDQTWHGEYQFSNTRIWDSARRLEPGMYRPGQFQCLSFGWTKPLQLGRVGAILTNDVDAYRLLIDGQANLYLDDLDLDSALPGSVTVVEWGGAEAARLSEDRLEINIDRSEEVRQVSAVGIGARWAGFTL